MSASPSLSSLRSGDCGTAESTSTVRAKKRTVVVVRRPKPKPHDTDDHGGSGHVSRKKTLMVSRRPRLSEGRLFDNSPGSRGGKRVGVVEGSNNNPTFGNMRWSTDGRVLERSILGTAEAFEQVTPPLLMS